jgi:hypothetical protein
MTDLQKKVIDVVCSQAGIEIDSIFSNSRKRSVSIAKHVCMYVFKKKFGLSYEVISSMFSRNGKKMNHTSVMHGVRSVQNGLDVGDEVITIPTNFAMNYVDEYYASQNVENLSNVLLISFHPSFPVEKLKDLIKSNYPTIECDLA